MISSRNLLAVCIGNTRIRVGLFQDEKLGETRTLTTAEAETLLQTVGDLLEDAGEVAAVVASVNPQASQLVQQSLASVLGPESVGLIGKDVPLQIRHSLDDATTVGQDRLLNAIAAFSRARQACIVADVGTAVTVDFVDGEGTFHGGIIFPGLNMMLRALHEHTAALPAIAFKPPEDGGGPLGKDTAHAMTLGVLAAVRGGVRQQIDACAELYGGYPQIIATGGDMAVLEAEGLIEHFVPDLQVLGVHECVRAMRDAED